jgi:signal transduction histidine kinase
MPAARLRAIELELSRAAVALEDLELGGRRPAARADGVPVSLRGLLEDSVEAWRAAAAARGVGLRLRWAGPDALVAGDRPRLAQATGNLIANAIEHGGGEISVRGTLASEQHCVRIEVVDAGPGLPASVADLAGRPRGGRGARGRGLAIAATIARDHGGRLVAAPCERGARLVLELPAVA